MKNKFIHRIKLERLAEDFHLVSAEIEKYKKIYGQDTWYKKYVDKHGEYWAKKIMEGYE